MSFLERLLAIRNTNKKVLLFGLGQENKQFLHWLVKVAGLTFENLAIAEQRDLSREEVLDSLEKEDFLSHLKTKVQKDSLSELWLFTQDKQWDFLQPQYLAQIEYIFKSPGIWSLHPYLIEFRKSKGIDAVLSPLTFFLERFRQKIIGITGTKGKTTTSTLTTHLLEQLLRSSPDTQARALYCGNTVNISPYLYWSDLQQDIKSQEYFVLELSSFQLQDLGFAKLSPHFSAITNYFIDHQDQHQSPQEYWLAKDQIWLHHKDADYLVCNQQIIDRSFLSRLFKTASANTSENLKAKLPNKALIIDEQLAQQISEYLDFANSPLQGLHNQFNLAIAVCLVELVNLEQKLLTNLSLTIDNNLLLQSIHTHKDFYAKHLQTFTPVKHRLELVRSVQID